MAEEFKQISKNFGKINPLSIDEYINMGGFNAFKKTLQKTRDADRYRRVLGFADAGSRDKIFLSYNRIFQQT